MARSYHVDIAAFATEADRKWIDNLLSHFEIAGVDAGRQGVARRLSTHAIYCVALVRRLTRDLGLSVDSAVALGAQLLTTDRTHVDLATGLSIHFDRHPFELEIDVRIAEAVESIVPARRGRPPVRGK